MIIIAKGRKSGKTHYLRHSKIIGKGGEGTVYKLDHNNQEVAKIYKEDQLSSIKTEKLEAMVANPPNNIRSSNGHLTFAFPIDVLEFTGKHGSKYKFGEIIGYVMPKLGKDMKEIHKFSDSDERLRTSPVFTYNYLINTALNFVEAVHQVHKSDCIVGDINETNIMVDEEDTLVTIIDADSFQFIDPKSGKVYPCTVGRIEYTPPELINKNFKNTIRFFYHDLFAMAVIIYQLLMENKHPFSGVYKPKGNQPGYVESIQKGYFIFNKKTKSPYVPHEKDLPFEILHPDIRELFLRCFEDGHTNPTARPITKEWLSVLKKSKKSLIICNINSQHYFGDHLNSCPWCERAFKIEIDPFPTQAEAQRIKQVFRQRANQKRSKVRSNTKKTKTVRPSPVIKSFQRNKTSIKVGQSLILSWQVENAQRVRMTPGQNTLKNIGSVTVSPTHNTGYTLRANAFGKTVHKYISVEVIQKPEVIFETSTDSVFLGQPITMFWDVAPKYSVSINNDIGNVSNKGQKTVLPTKYFWGLLRIRKKRKIVYKLTATNRRKTIPKELEINILIPDSSTKLAKYISINSKLLQLNNHIRLNAQSILLNSFMNLNQVITELKDYIKLLGHKDLEDCLGLKEISVSLTDFIELIDQKTKKTINRY